MTARNAASSQVASSCSPRSRGCASFYEIPIETPIQPKMDVTAFQRVLVAGFISGGTDDVDANLETVRLLRSQLRSKSQPARHRSGSAAARRDRRDESNAAPTGNTITTTVDAA